MAGRAIKQLGRWGKQLWRQNWERVGYRFQPRHRPDFFIPLLYHRLRQQKTLFFVQIGANDGRRADPIHDFLAINRRRVAGLVIEPVSSYFAQLKQTYAAFPNITPLQLAIHHSATELTMYKADPSFPGLPDWAHGIASLDPEHHRRSGLPPEAIITESVTCRPLEQLLADRQITQLDLLQIDTEGYDLQLLDTIDLDRVNAGIIRFEHGLPEGVSQPHDFRHTADRLTRAGYFLALESYDCVAYRPELVVPQLAPELPAAPTTAATPQSEPTGRITA